MSQKTEKLRRQVEQTRADVDNLRDRVDAVLTSSASMTSRYRRRAIAAERRVLRLKLIASLLAMASVALLALVIRAGADALPEDKPPAQAETGTAIVASEPVEEPENELIEAALLASAHRLDNVTVTHYDCCVECCGKADGITASGAGAVNRVIDIECKSAQAVIKDGMRISGAVKRNYGFAGRKFVERLYQPGVVEQVSERYRELFRDLSERDTTEKQAMAAAAIILADELACQWIFSGTQQPLTIEQISEFLASKAAVSAGDRGYKYLCDWVTQNSNKLCGRSENPNTEVLGALEDGRAYIIRSVFERILQDAGYSTAAMISYLKQESLIETRGRANTKGKRINGIPTECFCLRLPTVELDDEEDPDELPL